MYHSVVMNNGPGSGYNESWLCIHRDGCHLAEWMPSIGNSHPDSERQKGLLWLSMLSSKLYWRTTWYL